MAFDIEEREHEGICILDLKGRLTVGEPVSNLREKIRELADDGKVNVVLNLEGRGLHRFHRLGWLGDQLHDFEKSGRSAQILNLSKRNVELLILTKLTTVFELFGDEQDAVNSFFPNRQIQEVRYSELRPAAREVVRQLSATSLQLMWYPGSGSSIRNPSSVCWRAGSPSLKIRFKT